MDRYHLFNDDNGRIIAVEDSPEAIDKAPCCPGPVDVALADLALKMFGGEVIYSDRATVIINVA